ncbi:hypothetical protein [Sphingosinithalassobacter sp. LHW66-3]|uniref:hypothetical protein n=1 Tax=Sphingosinithalassobacter sp. LHW66-3 TaxID=3424718 RepID=UPI003D6A357F
MSGDSLDPKRWTARGGEGGPIYGDEFAYLKQIVAERLEDAPAAAAAPLPAVRRPSLMDVIHAALRRRLRR